MSLIAVRRAGASAAHPFEGSAGWKQSHVGPPPLEVLLLDELLEDVVDVELLEDELVDVEDVPLEVVLELLEDVVDVELLEDELVDTPLDVLLEDVDELLEEPDPATPSVDQGPSEKRYSPATPPQPTTVSTTTATPKNLMSSIVTS